MSYFLKEDWNFSPPPLSDLSDHEVNQLNPRLAGRSIALLVCGGIAAMRVPDLARTFRKSGAKVSIFVSQEALRYVTEDTLAWSSDQAVVSALSSRAEHLGDGKQYDAYLVVPATYNTINKFALGIADGLITTLLSSALGRSEQGQSKILVVPTMHGSMHNQILTTSLQRLQQFGVQIVKPRMAYGKHNIPSHEQLVLETIRALSTSPIKSRGILITGGPTPVMIDGVRRLTNKFTGQLSLHILEELYSRGAEARLLLGMGSHKPKAEFEHLVEWIEDYQAYRERCLAISKDPQCWAGVFSAAVADYQPQCALKGKTESGRTEWNLKLEPTHKVIDLVKQAQPNLNMVTFKYQEQVSHEQLMQIAQKRLEHAEIVIANRGEEKGEQGEQVAWLCKAHSAPSKLLGKEGIACGIADQLEILAQETCSSFQ